MVALFPGHMVAKENEFDDILFVLACFSLVTVKIC